MTSVSKLHAAVAAVAPIIGVSIGKPGDRATWRVDFDPSATAAQRTAAQNVINAFDITAEEIRVALLQSDLTLIDLRDRLTSATPAQIIAYVDSQVTDLASARTLLKRILLLLAVSLSS
jgi:hypothetical protein